MRYKKILVLNFITTTIGDSLYILPIIQKLKKEYPEAEIFLTGSKLTLQVIGKEPSLTDYVVIPNLEKLPKISKLKKMFLFKNIFFYTLKKIKNKNFDLAIVLLPNFSPYHILPWLAKIPKRIGFAYQKSYFSFLLNKKTIFRNPYTTKDIVHLSDSNSDILKLLEITITERDRILIRNVTKKEVKEAKKILKRLGKPYVAFQPGAKYKHRQWPPERFAEIGKKIIKKTDGTILLMGSPNEKELLENIKKRIGKNCINLAGKTSLNNVGAVLQQCKLVLGNDSGIMHLAASVGVQTAVLFGSPHPEHSKPLGIKKAIIIKPHSWHPKTIFEDEPLNKVSKYLLDIDVNLVWKKIEKVI